MKSSQSKIALLGTSADPPTCGHQALLEGLLTLFPKVITWASDNPMKQHVASLKQRQILLHALVQAINNPNLKLVQEISSPRTITTLRKASTRWPEADLTFVIGSDLAKEVPGWVNAKEILSHARLAIARRKGWPVNNSEIAILNSLGARIEFLSLEIPCTSSSKLRREPDPKNIPDGVLPIVIKQNLYGLNPN